MLNPFRPADVAAINDAFIQGRDLSDGLSPSSVRLLQTNSFTREEIQRAFTQARQARAIDQRVKEPISSVEASPGSS